LGITVDPVSSLALVGGSWLISGVLWSMVGAKADRHLQDVILKWRARLATGQRLQNHDLAFAVWWACLNTGALACTESLEDLSVSDKGVRALTAKLWSRLWTREDDVGQLWTLRRLLGVQVRSLVADHVGYFQQAAPILESVEQLLADPVALAASTASAWQLFSGWLDAYAMEPENSARGIAGVPPVGREARGFVDKRIKELLEIPLVGREKDLDWIDRLIDLHEGRSLVIASPAGYGKSGLLAHWLQQRSHGHVAFHFIDISSGRKTTAEDNIFDNLLGQILPYFDLDPDLSVYAKDQVGACPAPPLRQTRGGRRCGGRSAR
jgi:hypothetical protein